MSTRTKLETLEGQLYSHSWWHLLHCCFPCFKDALDPEGNASIFRETYWMHRFMEIMTGKACDTLTEDAVSRWNALARDAKADSASISRASVRAQAKAGVAVLDELCDNVIELSRVFARITKPDPVPLTNCSACCFCCFAGAPDPWTRTTVSHSVLRIAREWGELHA